MTQTPTQDPTPEPTPEPIPEPIVITSYVHRILWSITPGSINDKVLDEDGNEEEIPFPTTGSLPSTDITPDFKIIRDKKDGDPYNIIQPKFTVSGKVQRVTVEETETFNEDGTSEVEIVYIPVDVPYTLNSMTITSTHNTLTTDQAGNTSTNIANKIWVFPDDFPGASVPEGTPKEYGGIVLENASPVPVEKKAGETSSCGSDGDSGYQYLDVFYDYDFKYIPRNSVRLDSPDAYDDKDVKNSRDRFPTRPRFPEVVDEDGLKAPIMPIDMITTYLGDINESYTIEYKIVFNATIDRSEIDLIPVGGIQNPVLTVRQTVTQDTENFAEQLEILLGITNFNFANTNGLSFDDMSPGYPYAYPYTVVSGFDGQPAEGEPTERNTIIGSSKSEGKLVKGDLWYDDNTKTRKYYQVNSFVEGVRIISPGTIYSGGAKPTDFSTLLQKNQEFMKSLDNVLGATDIFLQGDRASALAKLKGENQTFEQAYEEVTDDNVLEFRENLSTYVMKQNAEGQMVMDTDSEGRGLSVDVSVNKNGGVVSAKVNNPGSGYKNGEVVAIYGGDCILEVKVNTDEFWRDEFVDRLGIGKRQFLGGLL